MNPNFRKFPALLLLFFCLAIQAQETRLRITVTDIETDKGIVRVALYDHPDQFPYDPPQKFVLSKKTMKEGTVSMVIPGIREGRYAISILDDVNGNDEMDYNIIHIPKEGYGFSNDIKPGLKPPPFEKCLISVSKGDNHVVIRTQYFGR